MLKSTLKLTLITLLILTVAGVSFAGKKDRKLTVGAYLSSAKIEIMSGEMERYPAAVAYLDSLFLHYGPHAEALHLMSQIWVDYIESTPGAKDKMPYVEKMVAYVDSLHMCCENNDINKKYRKDCDKYIDLADSTMVKYWRDFYNAGINQLGQIDTALNRMMTDPDSAMKAFHQKAIDANLDSCIANMRMAVLLDTTDYRPFVGMGSAYDKVGDFEKAIEWQKNGLERVAPSDTVGRSRLLFSIAYYNIQLNDFCGAIPYFKQYTDYFPDDTSTLYNLQACYNNCGFFDSALAVNHQILQHAPQNLDALVAIGLFHNQWARECSDTATAYQREGNEEMAKAWRAKRDEAFDSSLVYFKRAVDGHPDNVMALEQYATIVGLKGDNEVAAEAFRRLADLDESLADYPRAAGDFFLRSKQFDKAIIEYERTVQREPGDKETWERLADLYHNEGMADKEQQAKQKVKELE